MTPVLRMENICKSFFGIFANENVNLTVNPGEIHALLGENGAGKTTLMNILYGIYKSDSGDIFWEGERCTFKSPKDAINKKIGMVHQHFHLVDNLTVSENITLGLKTPGYPFTNRKVINGELEEISKKYGLAINPEAKISSLSVGEEQRVEIMKLLYRDTKLLILDEPTAVLTPGETNDFFDVLLKLKNDGKSVIIITHRIPEVMKIADRVTVLRDGRSIVTLNKDELSEEKLSECMIGRKLKQMPLKEAVASNESGLVVENLSVTRKNISLLDNVSFKVSPGEIFAVAGVDGNGQKPLAEAVLGITEYKTGHVSLCDTSLDGLSINERKSVGIGYISDDRHADGLIMDMSVTDNMLLRTVKGDMLKNGFIKRSKISQLTKQAEEDFDIKMASANMPIRLLSGGNQQKLILARELYEGVRLIIAFQPTRGLDIGASEFIRELLLSYRQKGVCILLISADLEEIFSVADKIAVIHGGKIMGIMDNDSNIDMTKFGLMMAGKGEKEVNNG